MVVTNKFSAKQIFVEFTNIKNDPLASFIICAQLHSARDKVHEDKVHGAKTIDFSPFAT